MKRIGYKAKILVVNDALVALEAGAPAQPGVVVIAGHRIDRLRPQRQQPGGARRRLGLHARRRGQRLLDRPGRAARRAARSGSPRPATLLTGLLLQLLRRRAARRISSRRSITAPCGRRRSPSLAQCVQGAFSDGDQVAIGILRSAADQLESSALSVARRLDLDRQRNFPFVLSGGIFRAVPWLEEELSRRLPLAAPRSRTHAARTTSPPRAPSASRSPKRAAATTSPPTRRTR